MTKLELVARNKELTNEVLTAIDLLTKIDSLPGNRMHDALVRQLIRCSISIGTNYGTAESTESTGDFLTKLKQQKIDNWGTNEKLNVLLTEANQLLSIYTPSLKRIGESQTS